MDFETKIKNRLRMRGFKEKTLLNNRGLIGATIEDTLIEAIYKTHEENMNDELNRFFFG